MARNFAFLSYSHKDKDWGDWLHAALERYVVPRALVGTRGSAGPIPTTLRPIFRDRVDMSAGDTVTATVARQLGQSDALIVICSPNAAGSSYVNEELRRFKASGRGKRIFPLIVGDPGIRAEACFPPALVHVVDAQGRVLEEREEPPLAADARSGQDGKDLAELKIIAGLIGVDLDVLRKREEIERRRRNRMYALTAAAMSVLAVAATALGVLSYVYKERAETAQATAEDRLDDAVETAFRFAIRTSALAEQRGIPNDDVIELLTTADNRLQHLREGVSSDSPGGAKLMQTLAVMNIAFARSYRTLGQREQWWHLANTARDQLQELAARRPDDIELKRGLASALMEVGETYREKGDARTAGALLGQAREMFALVHAKEGDSTRSLREMSRVSFAVGEVEVANDNLPRALELHEVSIALGRRAVAADSQNAEAVIELSEAIVGLGQTLNNLGRYAEAVETYRQASALREGLIATDKRNVKARRLLSWALSYESESLQELGRFGEAEAALKRALEARSFIYQRDETNTQLQRDVGWAHWNLAETLRLEGKLPEAEIEAHRAVMLFQSQHDAAPGNPGDMRRLAKALGILGRIELDQQKLAQSRENFSGSVALLRRVLEGNGASQSWRWDLAVAISDLGNAYFHAGQFSRSAVCFYESRRLHDQLVAGSTSPRSAHQRSMDELLDRIAQLEKRAGPAVVPAEACE